MDRPFSLVIANASLRGRPGETFWIGIQSGKVAAVEPEPLPGDQIIDAGRSLVVPAFVDAHLHLCKVHTRAMAGEEAQRRYTAGQMGDAMSAIELAAAVKAQYDESWIYQNARRALLDGLTHGVTCVQAFVDTDTKARLEGIRAILRLREELREVMEVRVVAFPQDGLLRDPGAEEYVREAMELGADVVGGIPWIEYTNREAQEHIDRMLKLARQYSADVAMLVDDAGDPGLRTTEMLAETAIRLGWSHRITACHARAMALYPEPAFRRLVGLAKRAGMAFVTDPHTGGLHLRVADLMDAGVTVALGQDDIADAYYAFGQHNMLEVAFLSAHILGFSTPQQMERLMDMVTFQGARTVGLSHYGIAPGCGANLAVLQGRTVQEALTLHRAPRFVVSRGRVVAETETATRLRGLEQP